MKATIDFDDRLYRRLKVEAARRGRTIRELVAEGVMQVLNTPENTPSRADQTDGFAQWRPSWLGSLEGYAHAVDTHSMTAVRASIATGRAAAGRPPSRAR